MNPDTPTRSTSHRPEWWADTPLTVDPDDWWSLTQDARVALADWMEPVVGHSLNDGPCIITATLGEGVLVTQEVGEPWFGPPPDYLTLWTPHEYAAPTPPPVWPARAGRDERHEGTPTTCPRCADRAAEMDARLAAYRAETAAHDPQDESTSR